MHGKWVVGVLVAMWLWGWMGSGVGYGQDKAGAQDGEQQFVVRVAARCQGEASFALGACACTVKNRLAAGWGVSRVLEHYYARDGIVGASEVALVGQVLRGERACPVDYYFIFSTQDRRNLGLGDKGLVGKVADGQGRAVWLYSREAFKGR